MRKTTLLAISNFLWLIIFSQTTIIKNVTVIDGTGRQAQVKTNMLIEGNRIISITKDTASFPVDATVIDLTGKTVMPMIINSHGHLGLLKGTTTTAENYTPENIRRHLVQFEAYGVQAVISMGTDREAIFGLRDSSRAGLIPGATIYTALRGFGVTKGAPPLSSAMDKVYRPQSPEEARRDVQELALQKPDMIKIWVDDFMGQFPKMDPKMYTAIIEEAHKQHLRVAAHLFYLEDARKLVAAGLDVIAHSIRDKVVDDALLASMKKQKVVYIPTLSLDEFAYVYQGEPEWMNDPFFKASLEPGVFEMISSADYKEKLKSDKKTQKEMDALKTALKNVKRIYAAGIPVALGTDAGAQPVRTIGFSEHAELELMVQAGLTPLQAISVATLNGARLLKIDKETGTLEAGRKANFIVMEKDPAQNIKNTRTISGVWKNGKQVSGHPAKRE